MTTSSKNNLHSWPSAKRNVLAFRCREERYEHHCYTQGYLKSTLGLIFAHKEPCLNERLMLTYAKPKHLCTGGAFLRRCFVT